MQDAEKWLSEKLHSILLATDFHQNSRLALDYAAALAQRLNSKLTTLNAFEFGHYSQAIEARDRVASAERKNALELLRKFTAEAGVTDVGTEVVVVEGLVTSAILRALAERSVDLLVIGTEGVHKGLDHFVLGSNTEALMLGAHCLTLTVGPQVSQETPHKVAFRNVIYISDFSVASTAAAVYAFAAGEALGVNTEVYQLASKAARKDPLKLENSAARYCDFLQFVDPNLPARWFDPGFQLSRIVPDAELLAKVAEPSNLIVLGVQPATFLQRHLHTSLAYRLLANAGSPILTVPAGIAGGRSRSA